MKWFNEGDRNTKFFHSYVRGRRKKLHIESIKDIRGIEVSDNDQKGEAAVEFFQNQFSAEACNRDYGMLQHIPRLISEEQNEEMFKLPSLEVVKKMVFKLNGESASGPDGFSGSFFQHCWEIIGEDLTRLVKAFFCGQELPKFITHTNLVLIPKKENVQEFKDLRPISLSNFTNKVISRMVHERL
uniref:Putative ovule protein n=1 Tax=Solanum chacoense TaxID=4108 RepID=A0A0V0HAW3_SOLCH